jgi:GT2 family glycosyltransferase
VPVDEGVFDELRGFDEHFFVSHEDVDLSYRARLLGYRCRYAADAVVRHHGSVTLGRTSAFAVFHGQRNLEWLYLKNSPLSILLRSMPDHLLYTAAAAGYFARLGLLGAFLRAKLAGRRRGAARAAAARACTANPAGRRRRHLAAARAPVARDQMA